MTTLGTDIDCVSDLDPSFGLVSGNMTLAQAIARRLTTARGSLFYDEDYGTDLNQTINDSAGPVGARGTSGTFRLRAAIEAEAMKDERVMSAKAEVSLASSDAFSVRLTLATADGPLELVMSVSEVTADLLEVS